jgi:hypothetical protein
MKDNKNRIPVNNCTYKRIEPAADAVYIHTENEAGEPIAAVETISGADFITMLNWYRYQKQTNNTNLIF